MKEYCLFKDCKIRPSYNFKGRKEAKFCKIHKEEKMVDIKRKLCQIKECVIRPSYNFKGRKEAIFCNIHKEDGMIDIISKICEFTNCNIQPSYNFKGEKKAKFCNNHKEDGMIDIKNKRCEYNHCDRLPSYNFIGEKIMRFCNDHKKDGMINIKSKRCEFQGCYIISSYNFKGEKISRFCNNHKEDGMIDIKSKRCEFQGCDVISTYNFKGEKISRFCNNHKEDGMIDIKHKTCESKWCDTQARNSKYKGYCLRCFMYMFPEEPVARNYKTKEKEVVDRIKERFSKYDWVYDKRIQDGCSRRRPDIFLDMGDCIIIVEIDENQHDEYECSCENKRLMEISQDVGHRPIVFIRFNPDDYKDESGKNVTSCWGENKNGILAIKKNKKVEWENRINSLLKEIEYWIENKTEKMLEVIQLFYDLNLE
jgi:hypothetical protein